jgi:hypothetical protein
MTRDVYRLYRAFQLVQPASHWKDPIKAVVPRDKLVAEGLTIEDVRAAVSYYTTTEPHVFETVHGFFVEAAGYRAGGHMAKCQTGLNDSKGHNV